LRGGSKGAPTHDLAHALFGPPCVQVRWAASCYLLDLAHGGVLRRWCGLVGIWPCSPFLRALILLVSGLSPIGLMSDFYNVAFLVYFGALFLCNPDMFSCK
jgi:hypothetical protein